MPYAWHLSHAPVAAACEEGLTVDILRAGILASDLELKHTVFENLEDIYQRFVINTNREHD